MSMIEKVARALAREYISHHGEESAATDDYIEGNWPLFAREARAAIEAMREPTDGMLQAGAKGSGEDSLGVAEGAWQAMIQAALSEEGAG